MYFSNRVRIYCNSIEANRKRNIFLGTCIWFDFIFNSHMKKGHTPNVIPTQWNLDLTLMNNPSFSIQTKWIFDKHKTCNQLILNVFNQGYINIFLRNQMRITIINRSKGCFVLIYYSRVRLRICRILFFLVATTKPCKSVNSKRIRIDVWICAICLKVVVCLCLFCHSVAPSSNPTVCIIS